MEKINLREEGFKKLGEMYGKEAEEALRAHYANIGPEYYLWLSDLFMPRECVCEKFDADGNRICLLPKDENGKCKCRGGGFYYSNSARDNEGYEIDIESTVQALHFLVSSGLINGAEHNLHDTLPSQMQKDVIAFAKSLQDSEDGYFYHPQWGKNIVPSRLGRDLGWATSILKELGDAPLYDTKNGHKGSLGAPTGVKTSTEGEKRESNSTWIEHLRSVDAFKEYLEGFDLKTRSYSCGNNINAQSGQFKARDKQGIESGEFTELREDGYAVGGFIDTFEKIFNSKQNPENGLWEDEVHYNSVNGLMKISTSYNAMGLKLNYASKAFKSAMQMVLLHVDIPDVKGKFATGSVDTYNPWSAMGAIFTNIKKFGTEEEYNELKALLKENVVDLINRSGEKSAKFKKPDGSFGYTWNYSPSKSQQAPVAVPETIEGDINGGGIALNGIFGCMCSALGVRIPFFTPDDYEIFIDRIKKRCNYK